MGELHVEFGKLRLDTDQNHTNFNIFFILYIKEKKTNALPPNLDRLINKCDYE